MKNSGLYKNNFSMMTWLRDEKMCKKKKKKRQFALMSVLILELGKLLPAKLLWILHWAENR